MVIKAIKSVSYQEISLKKSKRKEERLKESFRTKLKVFSIKRKK